MRAEIIDDGTMDTVVEYDGKRIRYDSSFRYSFSSDEEFLNAAFEDFYEDQTEQLNTIYESLPAEITLCYNDDCRGWKTANPDLEGYATVKCLLGCKDYRVLYKELPKITDAMWNRLQLEASDS